MKFFETFTQVAKRCPIVRHYAFRHFRQVGSVMNDKLTVVGSLLTKHCEFIATQRIRRACQICVLYRQIYNEAAIKNMAYKFAARYGARWRNCCKTRFGMLLGAAFFSWDKDGITEEELKRFPKFYIYWSNHMVIWVHLDRSTFIFFEALFTNFGNSSIGYLAGVYRKPFKNLPEDVVGSEDEDYCQCLKISLRVFADVVRN